MTVVDLKQNLKNLKNKLSAISIKIAEQKGIKTRIDLQCKELSEKIDKDQTIAKNKKSAQLLTLAFISERRESAIKIIENTGTYALRAINGEDYKLHFLRNDEKKNSAAFKMEVGIESNFGSKKIITGLMGERGGGIVESGAIGLRMGAIECTGYNGPLVLDEAWKSVSSDEKIHNVAKLLKMYVDTSKRQVIFATHKADVFASFADHIINVNKTNGLSNISYGKQ